MSTDGAPLDAEKAAPMPLEKWLWRSYLRAAIIPLLVIEITFLGIYWFSNTIVHRENVATVGEVSRDYIADVAQREALSIGNDLGAVSRTTGIFARQTLRALDGQYDPPAAEKARYRRGAQGGFHTVADNGTTASFYSNVTPIGPEQLRKVWKLAALDPLMMDIQHSNPAIASIYFNTFDSYNRIYPYFDVRSQYPANMDIPSYNFYYEADARHNPARKVVWTDAYIDPAGHGWMVSSIAPVWRQGRLEGVVGIDLTLTTIIDRLVSLDLPWDGYAVLLDREGRILALPPKGELDFRLKELTDHHYRDAITSDTFKPDSFRIGARADTRPLAEAIARLGSGEVTLQFDGPHLASFARIPGPNWTLVVIAPSSGIFQQADSLRDRLQVVGLFMLGGLLAFYTVFFVFLLGRARGMSAEVAAPLGRIAALIEAIGKGDYRQAFAGSRVHELDQLGERLVATGNQLGDAHARIVEQEQLVSQALQRQRQVNEEQVRFVQVMSHELRTPLAIVDSGAQIIDRKAESLSPDDLRERSGRMRAAVRRISGMLQKLLESFEALSPAAPAEPASRAAIGAVVSDVAAEMVPAERLALHLDEGAPVLVERASFAIVLRTVIDNALRYGLDEGQVEVSLATDADGARVSIANQGEAIAPADMARLGERFFRGANATETEGAGIGLFVARSLVEKMGGALQVRATSGGTEMEITLPPAVAERAEP